MDLLKILYLDPYFVAVDKPPGLLVHRSPIDRNEKRFALQMVRNQVGRHVYPLHRLDKATSGVLLFALSPEVAKQTAVLFQKGGIQKKYLAVVRGYTDESGSVDHPIRTVPDRFIAGRESSPENRIQAVTDYKRLAVVELPFQVDRYPTTRYSLINLYPRTGRRHQLRRHMKHIHHPIIGDTRYGKSVHNYFFRDRFNCGRLLLAALEIEFNHPITGKDVTITAEPDNGFRSVLAQLNWGGLL